LEASALKILAESAKRIYIKPEQVILEGRLRTAMRGFGPVIASRRESDKRWVTGMEFAWDDRKNAINLEKHGLSLELAALMFRSQLIEEPDERHDYGEQRFRAYGTIADRLLVCIFTDRQISGRAVRWIISLRKANRREVRKFNERIKAEAENQNRDRGGA
jgi:uncharacterized DUF497 family protein